MTEQRATVAAEMRVMAALSATLSRLRLGRGLTLDAVAAASGLSVGYLSRLEAGRRQPSLAALVTLARVHGVSVADLVGEPVTGGLQVARAEDRPGVQAEGLVLHPLGPSGPGLQAFRVVVRPERGPVPPRTHAGREWLYVLSGRLVLTVGAQASALEPGDSAAFAGTTPHRLNADGQPAEVLLVLAQPAAGSDVACLAGVGHG